MGDPKYTPCDEGLIHQDGYLIPGDEPLMILRGKDVGALDAICEYIQMLEDQQPNKVIVSHLDSSLERLCAFYFYQLENPDLQSVGCSRRAHVAPSGMLGRARKVLVDHGKIAADVEGKIAADVEEKPVDEYEYIASFECLCKKTGETIIQKLVGRGESFSDALEGISIVIDVYEDTLEIGDMVSMQRRPF